MAGPRLLLGLALVSAWGLVVAAPAGAKPSEYEVKAAFLYNFAKYVTWPAEAFEDPSTPLRMCVLGEDPFGDALREIAETKRVGDRALELRHVDDRTMDGCHVVFVGERSGVDPADLGFLGALVVGDGPSFADQGGTIGFVVDQGRVRFEINAGQARAAGLEISSQLLKLARRVLE